jgi:hypothetical protein
MVVTEVLQKSGDVRERITPFAGGNLNANLNQQIRTLNPGTDKHKLLNIVFAVHLV